MRKLMNLKNYGIYPNQPYDAEVEYLESTGTQWIDTGYNAHSGASVYLRFRFLSGMVGNDKYIFAVDNTIRLYLGTYQSKWNYGYDYYYQAPGIQDNTDYAVQADFIAGSQKLIVDGEILISRNSLATISTTKNWLIFARSPTNTGWRSNARLYYLRLYDNGVLVRDFIPVRFTNELGQSEGAMYDRVTNRLFRNQGTGSFLYGPDKHKISLPYDAEVEYLESTGTQYIKFSTGFYGIDLTTSHVDNNNNYGIIGAWNDGAHANSVKYVIAQNRGWTVTNNGNNSNVYSLKLTQNTKTRIIVSGTSVIIDGDRYTMGRGWNYDTTVYNGFALFGCTNKNNPVSCLSGRIYHCALYNIDGDMVHDFIPVRVGRIGAMYDRANPTGGPNGNGLYFSETDPLIAGPDKSNS